MQQWVIFDLDGTLIESEQIWRDVRRNFVIEHGGRWHDDAQTKMIGMRTAEWSHYIRDDLGVRLEPDEIAKRVLQNVVAQISQRVPVLPGANAALERLAGAFRLGVATSASRAVAQVVLEKTGWKQFFEVVVSADEVARGKPAPDVYLRALALLGADAKHSAAVEDSTNGIKAAHAAGLAVLAVPNRAFPPNSDALALACTVLATLDDLDVTTVRASIDRCSDTSVPNRS